MPVPMVVARSGRPRARQSLVSAGFWAPVCSRPVTALKGMGDQCSPYLCWRADISGQPERLIMAGGTGALSICAHEVTW